MEIKKEETIKYNINGLSHTMMNNLIGSFYCWTLNERNKEEEEFILKSLECVRPDINIREYTKGDIFKWIKDIVIEGAFDNLIGMVDFYNAHSTNNSVTLPSKLNQKRKTKTYIMKDENTGLYKIGKSKDPKHRERTLQSEKPTIKIVKVFNRDIEKELHNKYADYRVRGEWFDLTNIQVKYICSHY